jgi:hypothetical protein
MIEEIAGLIVDGHYVPSLSFFNVGIEDASSGSTLK